MTEFCWSQGKGRDGHCRAEEFAGMKRHMKPDCESWQKKRRLSRMS